MQRWATRSLCTVLTLAGACLLSLPDSGSAADKAKKEKDDYALLMVSVLTEEGFALPGIAVRVQRKQDRKPKWKGVSDRRGEVAVRLPAKPATYLVSTHSKERENQRQTVDIKDQGRVDILFRLPLRRPVKIKKEKEQ